MLEKLKLKHVGPAAELDFSFAPRMNLLAGDNGLGKSFILDCAWWALTQTWAGEQAWAQPRHRRQARISCRLGGANGARARSVMAHAAFDVERWRWAGTSPTGSRAPRGLVVHARVDGGFAVFDPVRNLARPAASEPTDWPGSYVFTGEQLWAGWVAERWGLTVTNGLLRDWVSWQQQDAPEFKTLRSLLELLSSGEDAPLQPGPPTRVNPRDARDIPTLELPYGNVPLTHASAGVRRILSLAYLIVWTWHEHLRAAALRDEPPARRLVLLVDEVDAHLHPRWQRLILPALLRVGACLERGLSLQIIAVTHAPLVLASVEPEFDPKQDALFMLDLARADEIAPSVVVRKAAWRPRGDANQWLVSEVFDLKTPRSMPAERALEAATVALRRPGLAIAEVRRIHRELHRVLKDTDPFWARWEARARAAGIKP